jgi:hypothetical protein
MQGAMTRCGALSLSWAILAMLSPIGAAGQDVTPAAQPDRAAAKPGDPAPGEPATIARDHEEPSGRWWVVNPKRFSFRLGVAYGLSYLDEMAATGLARPGPEAARYLDLVGQKVSNTAVEISVTTAYQLSGTSFIFAQLPMGVVEKRLNGQARVPLSQYAAALGEVGAGYSRELVGESSRRPKIELTVSVAPGLARYTSLGDGLWDAAAGLRLRKYLARTLYGLAEADYTYRFEKAGVQPGEIVDAGLGAGRLMGSGAWRLEAAVKAYRIAGSTAGKQVLLGQSNDLVVQASLVNAADGNRINLNISQLDKGINIKTNSIGFDWTMPIWRRY